jgi:geranylgeranyl diphosphate synthase type I
VRTISSDIRDTLAQYQTQVNERLEAFFDKKIKEAAEISAYTREVVVNAREYTLRGGKRLRPIFCIYGYKCLSDSNIEAIIAASISLELMQSYLLIHDDIMDEDELRRGKPTFHIICKALGERLFGTADAKPEKFGENIAIVAGDLVEAYGEEVLATSPFASECVNKALVKYAEIVKKVGYGQILDIAAGLDERITEDEILMIHQLKTASYTIEGPLHIGALLAGASEADLQILSSYGVPLGLAFQIQDDILGLFGSEEKTGKPVGSDIREGKRTLLIFHALQRCTEEEKKDLQKALGNPHVTLEEIERIRDIVRGTGSFECSTSLVEEMTDKAVRAIKDAPFRSEARDFLITVADFIGTREY